MKLLKNILTIVIIIGLSSCSDSNQETESFDTNNLNGEWTIDKVVVEETNETITDIDAKITFLDENTITFNSCNTGQSKFTNNDHIITIDGLFLTEIACSYDETIISNNLSGEYILEGDSLKIISTNNIEIYLLK